MRYLCLYYRHVTTVHKQFILAKQLRQKDIRVTNHQPCPSSMIQKLDESGTTLHQKIYPSPCNTSHSPKVRKYSFPTHIPQPLLEWVRTEIQLFDHHFLQQITETHYNQQFNKLSSTVLKQSRWITKECLKHVMNYTNKITYLNFGYSTTRTNKT